MQSYNAINDILYLIDCQYGKVKRVFQIILKKI